MIKERWNPNGTKRVSGREKEARGCFQDDAIVTALFLQAARFAMFSGT